MKDVTDFPWRDARIFTKNFNVGWYPAILAAFVAEFAKTFPETPFWFTHYTVPEANGDKPIVKLPDEYWLDIGGARHHVSLRFRFACPGLESVFVGDFLKRNEKVYVHDPIANFNVLSFAEDRIYSGNDWESKVRRAKLMGNLLYANCRLVLDTLTNGTGGWTFEVNQKVNWNLVYWLPLHLLTNIYNHPGGDTLQVYMNDKPLPVQLLAELRANHNMYTITQP